MLVLNRNMFIIHILCVRVFRLSISLHFRLCAEKNFAILLHKDTKLNLKNEIKRKKSRWSSKKKKKITKTTTLPDRAKTTKKDQKIIKRACRTILIEFGAIKQDHHGGHRHALRFVYPHSLHTHSLPLSHSFTRGIQSGISGWKLKSTSLNYHVFTVLKLCAMWNASKRCKNWNGIFVVPTKK